MAERRPSEGGRLPAEAGTAGPVVTPVPADVGPGPAIWRRPLRRRPAVWLALAVLALVAAMALFPGLFTDIDPRDCRLARSLGRPSSQAWFGYDVQGCDYLSRTVHGARASLVVGLTATLATTTVAVVLGSLAGYLGGWVDAVVGRVTDVWFAIPALLGAIVLLSVLERRGTLEIALVLAALGWPTMLRLMRSSVLSVSRRDYVLASRAMGASAWWVLTRHVVPNAVGPVLAYATIFVGVAITAEATLTFLGVGLRLPAVSWGLAISAAQHRLLGAPHLLLFPGLLLSATVLAFVALGDALQDALDPRR